jgi:hypothetical protein
LSILNRAKNTILINIVKTTCDTILAIQGSDIYPKITGSNVSEYVLALSGTVAGGIATF